MSAVVYRLPGAGGDVAPPASATVTPSPSSPITGALEWGRESMCSIVQRMLENADDTLFSMAEVTKSDEERRAFFESMRSLRKLSPAIVREFRSGLYPEQRKAIASADVELSLLDDSAVEEDIVVSRIVSRVDSVAKNALWEYGIRIENVSGIDNLRTSFEKLRPTEVARAFREALTCANVDNSAKLILFKLYERQLLSDAASYYDGINLRLEAAGITSKSLARRNPSSYASQPSGARAGHDSRAPSDGAFYPSQGIAPTPNYHLPSSIRQVLAPFSGGDGSSHGAGSDQAGYGAQIDLNSQGSLQRISLVNQLIEEMSRGWAPSEAEALRRLVLPLVRIALSDSAFFGDQQHPARQLLSQLGVSEQRAPSVFGEVESALQSLQTQAPLPETVAPLGADELHHFLLAQRAPRNTTSARLDEAREAAHAQIKSVGSGRDLPAGMASFLTQIWLPLVSAMHLRFGPQSPEIDRTSKFLERLFAECRWVPGTQDAGLVRQIVSDLESEMRQMAVPNGLIAKAQAVLQDGLAPREGSKRLLDIETFKVREPTPVTAKPSAGGSAKSNSSSRPYPGDTASWRAAVPPSSWFRLFDRANDRTQWLSAGVLYPQSNSLSFSGFDPEVKLSIDRTLFLQDVTEGKAEPVDPTEQQQSALRLLVLELSRQSNSNP